TAKHSVDRTLMSCLSLEQAAPDLLKAVCKTFGAVVGHLWIPDATDEHLELLSSWHSTSSFQEFTRMSRTLRLTRGKTLPGSAWRTGKSVLLRALTHSQGFDREAICKEFELRSGMAFPLLAGSRCYGVIEFF